MSALSFPVKQSGPSGKYNYPAGAPDRGRSPSQHRLRHVANQYPAIFLSVRRARLAKGRDGSDLAAHRETPLSNACNVLGMGSMLRKRALLADQLLTEARGWASELTELEIRGPGDLEDAWRRLEVRYGIPAQTFWSLRYRPQLKDMWVSVYVMLKFAVVAERERRAANLAARTKVAGILDGRAS
ncbi:MAG: hypothetical protein WC807_14670 [Hyphomicrobium sp.]|jgi:hypothetical protein